MKHKPLNKYKFYLISKIYLYPWVSILLVVVVLLLLRVPFVYADTLSNNSTHWHDYSQAKWGTTNPTPQQVYAITTPTPQQVYAITTPTPQQLDSITTPNLHPLQNILTGHTTWGTRPGAGAGLKALPDVSLDHISQILYRDYLAAFKVKAEARINIQNHILTGLNLNPKRPVGIFYDLRALHSLLIINTNLPLINTIFQDYRYLLNNCDNLREVLAESFSFLERVIPKEMWATTSDQLKSPSSAINCFRNQLSLPFSNGSKNQETDIMLLRLSITIYNSMIIIDLDRTTHFEEIFKIFEKQFNQYLEQK